MSPVRLWTRPARLADLELLWPLQEPDEHTVSLAQIAPYLRYPAITGCAGNVPIAAAGVIIPWAGYGQLWSVISPSARMYPIWLTKTARAFIRSAAALYQLRRLEATAALDSPVNATRWLERLGFDPDGVAWAIGPGGEHWARYVWYPQGKTWGD